MTPARLIRLVFNVGVLVGLITMTVGVGFYAGAAAAAAVFGLVVWITTIASTAFAVAMLPRPSEDG